MVAKCREKSSGQLFIERGFDKFFPASFGKKEGIVKVLSGPNEPDDFFALQCFEGRFYGRALSE